MPKWILALLPVLGLGLSHASDARDVFEENGFMAFIVCSKVSNENREVVKLYAYSEGVAGIAVQGEAYLLDRRLSHLNLPEVEMPEEPASSDGKPVVVEFRYKNRWKVKVRMFSDEPYKTALYAGRRRIPLVCRFTGGN